MSTVAGVDEVAARTAVRSEAARLTAVLRSAGDADRPALGTWDLADLATHVSHSLDAITAMARGAGAVLDDIWDLPTLSAVLVEGEATRSLDAIADRIDATVGELLTVMEGADGAAVRPWWVRGVELPLGLLTCQALNELVVHGYDIARAAKTSWPIERAHAVLVLEGYLFPALDALGRAMVDQQAAAGVRACFAVHLRGRSEGRSGPASRSEGRSGPASRSEGRSGPTYLCFDDGELSVGRMPPARVDCHLSVDPVAFLLVAWGRTGQWPEIARGRLLSWGRRPWLGLRLRGLLRNP